MICRMCCEVYTSDKDFQPKKAPKKEKSKHFYASTRNKLTKEIVAEIKKKMKTCKIFDLCEEYGVESSTLYRIRSKRIWASVEAAK